MDSGLSQTSSRAARIKLMADRSQIKNSHNSLSYVTVEIVDAQGRLVPGECVSLEFPWKATMKLLQPPVPIL